MLKPTRKEYCHSKWSHMIMYVYTIHINNNYGFVYETIHSYHFNSLYIIYIKETPEPMIISHTHTRMHARTHAPTHTHTHTHTLYIAAQECGDWKWNIYILICAFQFSLLHASFLNKLRCFYIILSTYMLLIKNVWILMQFYAYVGTMHMHIMPCDYVSLAWLESLLESMVNLYESTY